MLNLGGTSINSRVINSLKSRMDSGKIYKDDVHNLSSFITFNPDEHLTMGGNDKQLEYQEKHEKKTTVHWGQLKLFLSELEFFNLYWNPKEVPHPNIVYVGAASGVHINLLTELYPTFKFFLYDKPELPIEFDKSLRENPKIKIFERYFDANDVKYWKNQQGVFFISDIRNLKYNIPNANGSYKDMNSEESKKETEKMVEDDMRLQETWVREINPVQSLLKFRLPYCYPWVKNFGFLYLDGLVYFEQWTRENSTEFKLVPHKPFKERNWNIKIHESMNYHHNRIVRHNVNFYNIFKDDTSHICTELGLHNDYDSTATAYIIKEYLSKHDVDPVEERCIETLRQIIEKVTFGSKSLYEIRNNER